MLALTRLTGVAPSHREELSGVSLSESKQPQIFESPDDLRDAMIKSLLEIDLAKLSDQWKTDYTRLLQIIMVRFGEPNAEDKEALIAKLDSHLPADSYGLNWVLLETLVYLQAPSAAEKGVKMLADAKSQEPQMQFARSLAHLKEGWTP